MRNQIQSFFIVGLIAMLCGCASVAPGHDAIVVRSEQTAEVAFAVTDGFLAWEKANQATLPADVHQFAERLRVEGPDALRSLRALTRTYKVLRDTGSQSAMIKAEIIVQALQYQAGLYLSRYAGGTSK